MTSKGRVDLTIKAKNEADAAFRDATRDVDKFARRATGDFDRVKKSALGIKSAITGIVSVAALYKIKSMTDEWERLAGVQEQAEAGVKQAMLSMGRYSADAFKEVKDLSSALQAASTFGDEAVLQGTKFLLTYKQIPDSLLPRTMAAMVDLAALMKGDMTGAANMLGKASMGMTGELRRVGITVDAATYKSKGFLGVLKQIEGQAKGQALAKALTGYGRLEQFRNIVSDFEEKLGNLSITTKLEFLPAITATVKSMDDWVKVNAVFLKQEIAEKATDIKKAVASIADIYESLPSGVIGAAGAGLVGRILLGGPKGWLLSAIPLLTAQLGTLSQKLDGMSLKENADQFKSIVGLANEGIAWGDVFGGGASGGRGGGGSFGVSARVQQIADELKAVGIKATKDQGEAENKARLAAYNEFLEIKKNLREGAYQLELVDEKKLTAQVAKLQQHALKSVAPDIPNMANELEKALADPDQYFGPMKTAIAELPEHIQRSATEMDHIFENMLDGIQGSFRDNFREMLDDGLDSWKDFGARVEDIFKDTLANIAAYYMQNAVVLPIVGRMLGGGSTQAGMLSGGGIGGNASDLLGFGKMIPGVQNALGTPLWGGVAAGMGAGSVVPVAGAVGGPAALGAMSSGSAVGAAAGSIGPSLGMALGVAGIAAIAAPLIIGAISNATKKRPKWNLAGAGYSGFEDSFSVPSPFGPVGFGEASRGFDAHTYTDYLNKIAESDKLIAKALKSDQVEIVKNAMLSFNTGRSDEFTPEQFEEFFKVRLDYIASSIGKADSTYLEELVANFQRAVQTTATSLGSALTNGLKTGEFKDFETGLKDSIYNNVLQGMITAVTTSDIYTEMFRPVFSGIQSVLTSSFVGGEFNAGTFNAGMAPLVGQLQTGISSFQPAFTALSGAMTNLQNSLSGSPTTIINVNGGVWTTDDARQYFADLIAGNIQTGQGPPLMTSEMALAGVSLS